MGILGGLSGSIKTSAIEGGVRLAQGLIDSSDESTEFGKKLKGYWDAIPKNSDTDFFKTIFSGVENIPKFVRTLIRIHGIEFVGKKLIEFGAVMEIENKRLKKETEKTRAKDEKDASKAIKEETEYQINRELILATGDKTEVLSSEFSALAERALIAEEEAMKPIVEALLDVNLCYWLSIDPENIPSNAKEFRKSNENRIKALDRLNSIQGSTTQEINKKLDQLKTEIAKENGIDNEFLLGRIKYIQGLLSIGYEYRDILDEINKLKELLKSISPEELIDILNDYREVWLASRAYEITPFTSETAKINIANKETRNKFKEINFSYDPIIELGFLTVPDRPALSKMKQALDNMPQGIYPELEDLVGNINLIDSRNITDLGKILNGLSENKLHEFFEMGQLITNLFNSINNSSISDEDKLNLNNLANDYLSSDPYDPDILKKESDLITKLKELMSGNDDIELFILQFPTQRLLFLEEINILNKYNRESPAINAKRSKRGFVNIIQLFSYENRVLWDRIRFASSGDYTDFLNQYDLSYGEVNEKYNLTLQRKKTAVESLLKIIDSKESVSKLRDAYLSHLGDIAKGNVLALSNIYDVKSRDVQGILYSQDGVYGLISTLLETTATFTLKSKYGGLNNLKETLQREGLIDRIKDLDLRTLFSRKYLIDGVPQIVPQEDIESLEEFKKFFNTASEILGILNRRLVEIAGEETIDSQKEVTFIRNLMSMFHALGVRMGVDGEININPKILRLYLNGVETHVPTASNRLRDNIKDINEVNQISPNDVYIGREMRIKKKQNP